jgi:hypothetical protein
MAAVADNAAAIAAALSLGEESEEELINEENPPIDEEAIAELRTEFRNSLVRVFGYTEVSAAVIQDKLGLNEPVNLVLIWDSNSALESACNNLIRGVNHYTIDDEVPVFRFSMSQDLIFYREWVRFLQEKGTCFHAQLAASFEGHQGKHQAVGHVGVRRSQVRREGLDKVVQVDRQLLQAHARRVGRNP